MKAFNQAFEAANSTKMWNTRAYAKETVRILEQELRNNCKRMALLMKYIIDNNNDVLADFKSIYKSDYQKHIPKKSYL